QTVEDFARYCKRPPDQLGPEHIREYQAYLFRDRKLAARTVTQRLAGLRFFFIQTIKKAWSVADTPYPKKARHLPIILSPEEVALLIDSARTRFHHIVLMTLHRSRAASGSGIVAEPRDAASGTARSTASPAERARASPWTSTRKAGAPPRLAPPSFPLRAASRARLPVDPPRRRDGLALYRTDARWLQLLALPCSPSVPGSWTARWC